MKKRMTPSMLNDAKRHLRRQRPSFAALIREFPDCPLARGRANLFNALAGSMVGQQLSVKAATTIRQRVLDASDTPRLCPRAISTLSDVTCREAGLSGAKTRYLKSLAIAVNNNDINFRALAQQDDEAVIAALSALPGIGVWTAQMFLISGFRRPDIAAPADVGLQRGMQMLFDLDERPDEATFLSLSEPWRPYRSVASWYLWRLAG